MSASEVEERDEDPRVLETARDYLAEWEAGRVPNQVDFLRRYPDLEEPIRECLDGIDLAHAAGKAMRESSSTPTVEMEPLPREPLGDFRILREIGRGGMGVVYEAVQLSLGRRVALKVLPFAAALNSRQLQRFQTEAQAAAQLHHTNIVPVYAVGCERGVHFYAMQVIDGRPLDQVIHELRESRENGANQATLDQKEGTTKAMQGGSGLASLTAATARSSGIPNHHRAAAQVGVQVAEALEYAHEAGVVHRDIKPANLLLDGKGNAWVTDFGLARVNADTGITQTGDVFGTLRYMSPEQASGRRLEVDHRADVYSLGATLYELVCLEPAFPGQDKQRVLQAILNEEPQSLKQWDKSVPVELETIILKAMAKLPQERYQTAGEMAADLRRFLENRPILARRPSAWDHARKWFRRHPAIVWAGVAILVMAVVALSISTVWISHEQLVTKGALDREKQRAIEAEERFVLARRSADELILIADEELGSSPAPPMENLRRRLLESALSYYQELIELRKDDPAAQNDLSQTRDRVKRILDDLSILRGDRHFFLLNDPAVLDDLGMTEAQRRAQSEIMRDLGRKRDELFQNFRSLTGEQRQKFFIEAARERETALSGIMTPVQMERLRQIHLQYQGPMAFQNPEVIKALGITGEQRDRIWEILEQSAIGPIPFGPPREEPGGFPREEGGPPDRRVGRGGGFFGPQDRNRVTERIVASLTPQQRAQWQELTGRPFHFPGGRGGLRQNRGGFPGWNGPDHGGKGPPDHEKKGPRP